MISAALFDMDGLMIDSDRVISRAYETVLKEYGKEPRLNARGIVHTPGISALDNWRNLAKIYGIDADINELANKKNRLHDEYVKQGIDAMPGLMELLPLLREHNVKMAIASSSRRELVETIVHQLGIQQYFDAIVAGGEVAHGKPAPDIFLAGAAKLDANPADCVVFEDAIDGVRAAKTGGMACIAIPAASDLDNADFQIADIVLPSLEKVTWEIIASLSNQ
jgi:beta-phosphoglucomutase